MNIEEIKLTSNSVKKLADKGVTILAALKSYLSQEFQGHISIKRETSHSLLVTYYGYPLLFRIELPMGGQGITGQIVAYSQSYDVEPVESPIGVAYTFDSLGNINRRFTEAEFSPWFVSEIFTKICEQGITLRP